MSEERDINLWNRRTRELNMVHIPVQVTRCPATVFLGEVHLGHPTSRRPVPRALACVTKVVNRMGDPALHLENRLSFRLRIMLVDEQSRIDRRRQPPLEGVELWPGRTLISLLALR